MPQAQQWAFPEELQPKPSETQFDLARACDAMVMVRAEVPEDAFTAGPLGTERGGYGIVIAEGLVLTIGYLITEATQIWLTTNRNSVVQGYPLAVDSATGFGLIQPLGKLEAAPLPRGMASEINVGDSAFVLGHGGLRHALKVRVIGKQEFAGPWEYLLDEALFTAPAHPQWGGSALLDAQGDLVGVGSLMMQRELNGEAANINMFVPVDLLAPILDSLLATARSPHPPPPWLGMYTQEAKGRLLVGSVTPGGPAAQAGVREADVVLGVGEERVPGMAELFRAVRRLGPAGVSVPLMLARSGDVLRVNVKSADRGDYLRKPNLQ